MRPVIAGHGDGDPEVPGYRDQAREEEGGNIFSCLYGATLVRFGTAGEGGSDSGEINGVPYTISYTITNGELTFEATGALVTEALIKGGPATTIYDYSGGEHSGTFPGPGIAHDDGLIALEGGISNVGFCLIPIVAEIEVEKTGPELSKVGDPTGYTVTITNTGDVELFIESVSDSLAGNLTAAVVAQCGPLAVDEECVYNYSYTPTANDTDPLLNTVEVSTNTAADFSGTDATGSDSASVNLFQPSIEVGKSADVETAVVGDVITYTVVITNTSSMDSPALDLTAIDDTLAGDLLGECPDTLAAGANCTFDYTYTVTVDSPDPLENTVSVESNPVGFPNDIDDEASDTVDLLMPSIDVEKDGPDLSKVTDPTAYSVTITNTGETPLFIESIDDTLQGDLTDGANVDTSDCGASLGIGLSCTITYTYVVQEGDDDPLPNTVTVVANTAEDFTGVEVDDSDSVNVELFQPDIEVTKDADVSQAAVGDDVTYTVTIENTSSADSPDLVFDAINDTLQGDLTDAMNVDSSDCGATLAAGDLCTIVYTRTVLETDPDPLPNTVTVESHPDGFTNDIDDSDDEEVDIVEETGSITIVKEIECEECETLTIGYWFNQGGSHDEHTNRLLAGGIEADGITFTMAQQVRDYRAADQNGTSDGQPGLSARGQLTLQYLAASLNVLNNGTDCELAERVFNMDGSPFNGWTVQEILDEAELAFDGMSTYSDEEIKDALDAINNSTQLEENPLTCGEGSESGTLDGVTFEIYVASEFPDGDPIATGMTGDDGPGTLVFDGLTIGEDYVIVEAGFPEGLTCEIVGVSEPASLVEGAIHVTLTEEDLDANLNLTLTVENDCEEEQEEEVGSLLIAKTDDAAEPMLLGGATFEVNGIEHADTDEDGFVCVDGLTLGATVSVEETVAPDGYIGETGVFDVVILSTDTCEMRLALEDPLLDADIVFVNEEEDDETGRLEIIKWFCPTEGEDAIFWAVLVDEPLPSIMGAEEDEMPSDEGCTLGAPSDEALGVWFEIEGGDLTEPLLVQTEWEMLIELDLAPGMYTVTEVNTGLSAEIEIVLGGDTVVTVFNFEEEEDEEGRLKLLKFSCDNEGDTAFAIVESDAGLSDLSTLPGNCASPAPMDATFTLTTGGMTSVEFTLGEDGARLIPLNVGTYTLNEVDPNEATSPAFDISDGETTTVIVFNFEEEGEGEEPNEETPNNGGQRPNQGTAGGNPPRQGQLPNTATAPDLTGSLPAGLLALVMLAGVSAAGYAMAAERRRR